jgi:hypothetical protein
VIADANRVVASRLPLATKRLCMNFLIVSGVCVCCVCVLRHLIFHSFRPFFMELPELPLIMHHQQYPKMSILTFYLKSHRLLRQPLIAEKM